MRFHPRNPSMSQDNSGSDDPLVQLFLDLAAIPSPSGREREVVDFIIRYLAGLGLEPVEEEPLGEDTNTAGNLYCQIPGNGSGISVLLSAHTDTVHANLESAPAPYVDSGVIRSGSRSVLGADDKAAIAAILDAVGHVINGGQEHSGIELLLTVSEEEGLKGAKASDLTKVKARCGFCFDSTGPVGEVIVRSPTQKTIRATFEGKSAHAGVAPEEGRSAVVAASRAIAAMELGRIDADTTANIGVIRGGEAVNVVPDRCSISGESRSHEEASLERQVASMLDAINRAAAETGVDAETSVVDEFHAFDLSGGNLPVELAEQALANIGIKPVLASTGGGSDVNEFNRKGLEAVNLSVGMEKVHTPDEFITIESLRQARDLVLAIVNLANSYT